MSHAAPDMSTTNQQPSALALAQGSAGARYFRARGGYTDGTRALEWDGKRMWLHLEKGPRTDAECYSLAYAEMSVRSGAWEEFASLPNSASEPRR